MISDLQGLAEVLLEDVDCIWLCVDNSLKITKTNKKFTEFFDYQQNYLNGFSFHGERVQELFNINSEAVENIFGETSSTFETIFKDLNSCSLNFKWHSYRLSNSSGYLVLIKPYYFGLSTDDSILDVINFFNKVPKGLPFTLYWVDKQGTYLGANDTQAKNYGMRSWLDYIGLTREDFSHRKYYESQSVINDNDIMQAPHPVTFEEHGTGPKGEELMFISRKCPILNNDNEVVGLFGISMDITDQKEKRDAMRRSKELAEMTLDSTINVMPGLVFWTDLDRKYLGCNMQYAALLGFKNPGFIIGKEPEQIHGGRYTEKDQEIDDKVLTMGESLIYEETHQFPNGTVKSFITTKVPRNINGKIQGLISTSFDITSFKEHEHQLQMAQEKIRGYEVNEAKLKAMATQGGMIAHELRTPLLTIRSGVESLKKYLPSLIDVYDECSKYSDSKLIRKDKFILLRNVLDAIEDSTKSSNAIIDMLLGGLHDSALKNECAQKVYVKNIINKAVENYPYEKKNDNILIIGNIHNKYIIVKEAILINVIHNIIRNSIYAIEETNRGVINIWTSLKRNVISIHIKDTAKGIKEENIEKIFNPFYTSKEKNTSVGLGLYFCKAAIERIGGSLSCKSKFGSFTEFCIEIPMAD